MCMDSGTRERGSSRTEHKTSPQVHPAPATSRTYALQVDPDIEARLAITKGYLQLRQPLSDIEVSLPELAMVSRQVHTVDPFLMDRERTSQILQQTFLGGGGCLAGLMWAMSCIYIRLCVWTDNIHIPPHTSLIQHFGGNSGILMVYWNDPFE